jgi:hypothetical protein
MENRELPRKCLNRIADLTIESHFLLKAASKFPVYPDSKRAERELVDPPRSTALSSTDDGKEKDIAKYFVPASTIRAFIPTDYRF